MVAMNAETYARDVKEVAPGGFLIYDSTWPRPALLKREDITVLGVPLAKLCNENFPTGCARASCMKNICYAGVLAALLDLDLEQIRSLLAETYAKKPQLVDSNMKAIQLGYDYAKQNFHVPVASARREDVEDSRPHHDRRQHGRRARLRVRRRDSGCVVSDYAIDVGDGCATRLSATVCASIPRRGATNFAFIQAEDELAAIGMTIGAMWNGARAFTATFGSGHLADERVHRPRLLRRSAGGDLRHSACRALPPGCRLALSNATSWRLRTPHTATRGMCACIRANPEECFYMAGAGLRSRRRACRRRCS